METGRKVRGAIWVLAAVACCVGIVVLAPGAARAGSPDYPADAGCYDPNIDCGGGDYESGVTTEPAAAYQSVSSVNCRTRWARATRRNLFHLVVFRYNEQVRWCWSGNRITYFWRDRWPSDTHYSWSFDRHVNSNCTYEHCNNRGVGTYSTDAWTQGQFHVCVTWYCSYKC
jgi:hypothetical protein